MCLFSSVHSTLLWSEFCLFFLYWNNLIFHFVWYTFHIKPKVQSQRCFRENGAWFKCSRAALIDSRVVKAASTFWGILEAYSSQMLQFAMVRLWMSKTARPLGRGQDAESNFVNPHSFRKLSAYSWKIPLTVFIPSGLIPRTQYKGNNDSYTCPRTECRNDNLLPQPFLVLSAL